MVRKTLLVLFLLLIIVQAGFPLCKAHDSIGVEIPVDVELQDAPLFYKKDFQVVIEALGDYPLPKGAEGQVYTMMVKAGTTRNFPIISFDTTGEYAYRLYQTWSDQDEIIYDRRTYLIKIYVLNDEENLIQMVSFRLEDESDKCGEVVFENTYGVWGGEMPMPISFIHFDDQEGIEDPEDKGDQEDSLDKKESKALEVEEKLKKSLPPAGESVMTFYLASLSLLVSYVLLKKNH